MEVQVPLLKTIKHYFMSRSRLSKYHLFTTKTNASLSSLILDVGVADEEYSPHDNFLEKQYPYVENITALSIYSLEEFRKRYPAIKTVVFSGGQFPFRDNQFDIVHSNAVIEHVGSFEQQVAFVREIIRVGHRYFFSTPSRYFPVETHTNVLFLHYLPKSICDNILSMIGKSWATGNYMNLLHKCDLELIMKNAGAKDYQIITKRFLGFPLHYIVIGEK